MLVVPKSKINLSHEFNTTLHTESSLYVDGNNLYKILNGRNICDFKEKSILDLEKLNHPSCVTPNFAISNCGNICGYSMDYLRDYMTLNELIESREISIEQRKQIIHKIEDVLKYFEKIGFYYEDIHANNILINDSFDIRFIDLDSGYFFSRTPDLDSESFKVYRDYLFSELALQLLLEYVAEETIKEDFPNYKKNAVLQHMPEEKNKILRKVFYYRQEKIDVCDNIDRLTSDDVNEIQHRLRLI